jgi:enoyl-CoA hydratase/carnithine racemase
MANQMVKWEVKDGIGTISLNRQEKRNAINGEVLEGINKAFSELSLSLEAKVILLQGVGPAFSAALILAT